MSSLLVVGSIALDSVRTPAKSVDDILGGSASFFAFAAAHFTKTRVVGVVGHDFPKEHLNLFHNHPNIDARGIAFSDKKTFRWTGEYKKNMNERETLDLQLNAFGEFKPVLPDDYKDSSFIFLANGSTLIQQSVVNQLSPNRTLIVGDTMDHWILSERAELEELLKNIDILSLNDSEAKLLAGDDSLIRAAKYIISKGPSTVVIKKGEHGALIAGKEDIFSLPAFPLESVSDPTGAGDSFAGGFMGYLASTNEKDFAHIKRAAVWGTVIASFTVQDFGADALLRISRKQLQDRYDSFVKMCSF